MYLKSLELQGFKSFPDKIKLDFNKGLTAVVGPNGSGKSNIGDAVRWVLGEQSSKTLRGSKMEDVIFSGTQYRKSVGFAQVTLNIENKSGLLQIPAEEVSVTRKLYRSGESEYLINGSQVRLKDVYELFMDTGLGRDGYSIIGQGRISEIVSAKSNERREIFEEAAGISKFRYRKAEAERRLSAAQENILRLKDILTELEGRVEPLRLQSEKAARFLMLSEEKKALEVSVWVKRLENLKIVLSEMDEKLLISSAEYENTENDIRDEEEGIQANYQAMQACTASIEEFQNRILETERANGQTGSDIAVYENDIRHSQEAIVELQRQQDNARLSFNETAEKMKQAQENIREIEAALAVSRTELEEARSTLELLMNETDGFHKDFEDSGNLLNQLYGYQAEQNFAIRSAQDSLVDIFEQLNLGSRQEEELAQSQKALRDELSDVVEGLKEIDDRLLEHTNKLSGYTRLYETRLQKLDAAKKAFEQELYQLKGKQQKLHLLSDLENNMEGFAHSVKEILRAQKNSRISGIKGSVAQLIQVEGRYSVAIETALGASLQNIVVENEETAKRCMRLLKEQNAGRATFLPISSVRGNSLVERGLEEQDGFISPADKLVTFQKEYSGIISSLLGRIAIAEDIDSAAEIARKYGYRFKIVTLDGQVVNAGGSFTGGSASRSTGVLTRKNEIQTLQIEISELTHKQEAVKTEVSRMQAESDKLRLDIEGEKDCVAGMNEDKIRFLSEKKRLELMAEQAGAQLENTVLQILKLKERQTEQENKLKGSSEELQKIATQIQESERSLAQSQDKKDRLHQQREELSGRISYLKIREMELLKDKEAAEKAAEQLSLSRQTLDESALLLQSQMDTHTKTIEAKQEQIAERRTQLTQSEKAVQSIRCRITEEQAAHRRLEQKATEARGSLRTLNENKESISRELSRLQERHLSVQKDYDGIISELWEQYQLTRSGALGVAKDIPDMLMAQRDLNELKNSIRALGTVNIAAIEEYKEVFARYKFMSEQLGDVEVSKKELERLISELTDIMRSQFSESFVQINANFKAVFAELFGGGIGELILTNPEDVLESGVEINVAPPGKVIRNLSLLSGGEQAFVAIAIYFAILKLKPAPFCILDEIEAALDDVNVAKYAAYLRNFTKTTQFILITHRRGTMEEADVLYGVTMQEKGISKLLKMEQPALPEQAG